MRRPLCLLLAAHLLSLATLGHAQAPAAPEKVFAARCASCHSAESIVKSVAKRPAKGRLEWLEKFLGGHFPPDEATRKALAAWLHERASSGK